MFSCGVTFVWGGYYQLHTRRRKTNSRMITELAGIVFIALVFRAPVYGSLSDWQTTNPEKAASGTAASNASSDLLPAASDEKAVLFQVEKTVACSSAASCRFSLREKFPAQSAERLKGAAILPYDRCILDGTWASCCQELGAELGSSLSALSASVYSRYLSRLALTLRDAKCQRIFCGESHCAEVQCSQLDSCNPQTTSTLSMSSSTTSPGTSDVTGASDVSDGSMGTEAKGGGSVANAGGKETRTTTIIIIIVVSCLLAFLAGLGGAFLLICLRRRWRKGAGSQATDPATGDERGRELGTLDTNTAPAQSKAAAGRHHHHHQRSASPPDSGTSKHPTLLTSSTPSLPHPHPRYLSPPRGRKLPTAPPPPLATQPLAGNTSRGQTRKAGHGMCQALGQERERSELAKTTSEATRRERTSGHHDDVYSPLKTGGGRAEDSEYAVLNLAEADEKKDAAAEETEGEASHDYLDVLPEYVLSQPIR